MVKIQDIANTFGVTIAQAARMFEADPSKYENLNADASGMTGSTVSTKTTTGSGTTTTSASGSSTKVTTAPSWWSGGDLYYNAGSKTYTNEQGQIVSPSSDWTTANPDWTPGSEQTTTTTTTPTVGTVDESTQEYIDSLTSQISQLSTDLTTAKGEASEYKYTSEQMLAETRGIAQDFSTYLQQATQQNQDLLASMKTFVSGAVGEEKAADLTPALEEAYRAYKNGTLTDQGLASYVNRITQTSQVAQTPEPTAQLAPETTVNAAGMEGTADAGTTFAASVYGSNLGELDNLLYESGENLNSMSSIWSLLTQNALAVNENNNLLVRDYVENYKNRFEESYNYWSSSISSWANISQSNLESSAVNALAYLDEQIASVEAEKANRLNIMSDINSRTEGYTKAVLAASGVPLESSSAMMLVNREINMANLNYAEVATKYNLQIADLNYKSASLRIDTAAKVAEIQMTALDNQQKLLDSLNENLMALDSKAIESEVSKETNRLKILSDYATNIEASKQNHIDNQLAVIKQADERQQNYIKNAMEVWKQQMASQGVMIEFDQNTGSRYYMQDSAGNFIPTIEGQKFALDQTKVYGEQFSKYMGSIISGDIDLSRLSASDLSNLESLAVAAGLPANTIYSIRPDADYSYKSMNVAYDANGNGVLQMIMQNNKTGEMFIQNAYGGYKKPDNASGTSILNPVTNSIYATNTGYAMPNPAKFADLNVTIDPVSGVLQVKNGDDYKDQIMFRVEDDKIHCAEYINDLFGTNLGSTPTSKLPSDYAGSNASDKSNMIAYTGEVTIGSDGSVVMNGAPQLGGIVTFTDSGNNGHASMIVGFTQDGVLLNDHNFDGKGTYREAAPVSYEELVSYNKGKPVVFSVSKNNFVPNVSEEISNVLEKEKADALNSTITSLQTEFAITNLSTTEDIFEYAKRNYQASAGTNLTKNMSQDFLKSAVEEAIITAAKSGNVNQNLKDYAAELEKSKAITGGYLKAEEVANMVQSQPTYDFFFKTGNFGKQIESGAEGAMYSQLAQQLTAIIGDTKIVEHQKAKDLLSFQPRGNSIIMKTEDGRYVLATNNSTSTPYGQVNADITVREISKEVYDMYLPEQEEQEEQKSTKEKVYPNDLGW